MSMLNPVGNRAGQAPGSRPDGDAAAADVAQASLSLPEFLRAALDEFNTGLATLEAGEAPSADRLFTRFGQFMDDIADRLTETTLLHRKKPDLPGHVPIDWTDPFRPCEETILLQRFAQSLDLSMSRALDVLAGMLTCHDFDAAQRLTDWCSAIHPQLGLLPRIEVANAQLRAGRTSEALRILEQAAPPADAERLPESLAAAAANLIAHAKAGGPLPTERVIATGLPPDIPARCLAVGSDAALFFSCFSGDLSQGQIRIADPQTLSIRSVIEDTVSSGLHRIDEEGSIMATVLRSGELPAPHLAWFDPAGRLTRRLELSDLPPRSIINFGVSIRGRIFLRDLSRRTLLEIDPHTGRTAASHGHRRLISNASISTNGDQLFIHFLNGLRSLLLEPDTGRLVDVPASWPQGTYRIIGTQRCAPLAFTLTRLFDIPLETHNLACTVWRLKSDAQPELLAVFAGRTCSDIAASPDGRQFYITDKGAIKQFTI